MQVVAEKGRFDILAEFAGGLVSAKRDEADGVSFGALPLSVKPRTGDDKIGVLRVVLFRMTKDLPRSPRIFLIPKSGNIQIGHGRGVKLAHPCFLLPEFVVVGMFDAGIPVRDRAMKILGVYV